MFCFSEAHISRPSATREFLSFLGARRVCRGLMLDSLRGKIEACFFPRGHLFCWEARNTKVVYEGSFPQTFLAAYQATPFPKSLSRRSSFSSFPRMEWRLFHHQLVLIWHGKRRYATCHNTLGTSLKCSIMSVNNNTSSFDF